MFLLFFFLGKKEPKIQSASWRKLQSFSRSKNLRSTAEKIDYPHAGSKLITFCPALFRQNQPHHYQRMISLENKINSRFYSTNQPIKRRRNLLL
jgi:hypothetical protein